MFCPKCRYEYEQEISMCPDCGILLVGKLQNDDSSKQKHTELVPVLSTFDTGIIVIAKSLLLSAGIDFYAKGEDSQNLFAGTGGFIDIMVDKENLSEALEILQELN